MPARSKTGTICQNSVFFASGAIALPSASVSSSVATRLALAAASQRSGGAARSSSGSSSRGIINSGQAAAAPLWRTPTAIRIAIAAAAQSAPRRQPRRADAIARQAAPTSSAPCIMLSLQMVGKFAAAGGYAPTATSATQRAASGPGRAVKSAVSPDQYRAAISASMPSGPGTTRSVTCQISAMSGG